MSLCFRCEHRARFHELGHAPRCECGEPKRSVCTCYMYRPVMPCVLVRAKGDRRPMFAGAMIAARMSCLRVATEQDVELQASKVKGGHLLHWSAK